MNQNEQWYIIILFYDRTISDIEKIINILFPDNEKENTKIPMLNISYTGNTQTIKFEIYDISEETAYKFRDLIYASDFIEYGMEISSR